MGTSKNKTKSDRSFMIFTVFTSTRRSLRTSGLPFASTIGNTLGNADPWPGLAQTPGRWRGALELIVLFQ